MAVYNNIYEGLKSLYPKLNASGYILESTKFPYCYLSQLSNILDHKDSFLNRFESSIYQYTIYAESDKEVDNILDEIQDAVTWKAFELNSPKKLTLLEFLNRSVGSNDLQVYYGRLAYTVLIEKNKQFSHQIHADSIKNGINRLWNLNQPLVINDFNRESELLGISPYCRIPELTTIESWLTSKSRIESTNLSIELFSPGLPELLNIFNNIENRYDYCKIIMPNNHMIFEWEGNSIEEIEPQVWMGKINYSLLNEVLIDGNN